MNPECQDKCIEEVDRVLGEDKPGYDNVLKLQYLDNCLNETLRMYAPAAVANRHVEEDCDIRGYKVPKGAGINICIYAIHHDPEYWPEPYKFDPDRFSTDRKKKAPSICLPTVWSWSEELYRNEVGTARSKGSHGFCPSKYRFVRCTETEDPVALAIGTALLRAKNGIKLRVQPRRKEAPI
uniref:Cytochrome P450 n=1 Tax=Pinctada fucata TaxID=50426 RepID=A0A194AJH2_PINFU